ncbi:MAG: FliO/MopB family protein [Phycisphaerales bacterium]|nr:FliO/MopB family protein [Planctomycetota bacterium]MBL6997282.1 FliO/MopB family protein [Phycisphaerales bacterium]
MAKMRSVALQCCSCVISVLSVRTSYASESTPLPLPANAQEVLSMGLGTFRVLIALAIIVCLIIAIRWVIKRGSGSLGTVMGQGTSIEIIERKALGAKQALVLVRVKDKGVLLHQVKGNLTPLCEVDLQESQQE